jgi:pimeloyl-ACP methyl ester carboxylesterase
VDRGRAGSDREKEYMMTTAPRFLYLHGFASGPSSAKGVATAAHYASRGIDVERLNLRLPSFEHLRVSAMIEHVRRSIGGSADRAVLFGSSLGGYVASRVAAEDARVCSLVLLAPAFRLFERWRRRYAVEWRAWEETGWLEVDDHAEKKRSRVDFGFVRDAEPLDAVDGGFPDVRVPTLIVHGARDDTVDVQVSRSFAAGKRHVRLVEVDDGHDLLASLPLILREADAHLVGFLGPA